MRKRVLEPERRTNPLIWCAALICTVLTIAVIITGFAVFVGYLVLRPKVPQMSVKSARLESIDYDMAGILAVKVSVVIAAQNDNARAHASFYKTSYALSFGGVKLAYLNAEAFDVPKNSSRELYYLVESTPVPLSPEQGETVEAALRQSHVAFDLKGTSRTRWRIWMLGSVKFWLHLDCQLKLPLDRTTLYPKCSTKSRYRGGGDRRRRSWRRSAEAKLEAIGRGEAGGNRRRRSLRRPVEATGGGDCRLA